MANLIILPNGSKQVTLPDNDQWTNRFYVNSASSNVRHTIAQNKAKRFWGCSCNGWKRWKKCHHLEEIGLPCHMTPYEPKLSEGSR